MVAALRVTGQVLEQPVVDLLLRQALLVDNRNEVARNVLDLAIDVGKDICALLFRNFVPSLMTIADLCWRS